MSQRIEISYKTILFTVFVLSGIWVLVQITNIILMVLLAIVAASGLRAPINKLESYKIPRVLAIIITYIIIIIALVLIVSSMVPVVTSQTNNLVRTLGEFMESVSPNIDGIPNDFTNQIAPLSSNIYKATLSALSTVVNIFSFFALSFYLLMERRHMRVFLRNILGEEMKERVVSVMLKIEDRLGAWVRGQISLMVIVGTMTYIGLVILGIEYALPLAILAGLLELVPIVGPIISAIPAIIVASFLSPWLALATGALYFLVQQLENNVIVPMVMRRAVGVPPAVSIVGILIGAQLLGLIGAILAIPVFVSAQVILQELVFKDADQKKDKPAPVTS